MAQNTFKSTYFVGIIPLFSPQRKSFDKFSREGSEGIAFFGRM